MGHYTSYNLDVNNVKSQAEHEAIINKLIEFKIWGDALHDGEWNEKRRSSSFYNYDVARWHDHDQDMIELSKVFPEMTFNLCGTGEDADDRWYTLYRNGEYETIYAEIVWPEPQRIKWEE